jgi:hypothetical protein
MGIAPQRTFLFLECTERREWFYVRYDSLWTDRNSPTALSAMTVRFDDEMTAFVTGGVSVTVTSRSAALVPSISRAMGCRVIAGKRLKLRVFVSQAQAGDCLDDIRSSGMISATFSKPNTHRTLQFKGTDAAIQPLSDEDKAALVDYEGKFAEVLAPLGFDAHFVHCFLESPDDVVAVEFTPSDAFQQTPGPGAGQRLS